jgi:class 3 adenylate cyclase
MMVIEYFDDMAKEAARVGGKVVSLLGNHEISNVLGDTSMVSFKSLSRFGAHDPAVRARAFARGEGPEALRLACTRPAFLIVGSWLFGHAGVTSASLAAFGIRDRADVHHLNERVRHWLLGREELSVRELKWIFWDRTLGLAVTADDRPMAAAEVHAEGKDERHERGDTSCEKALDSPLRLLKVRGIVVGHTVTENGSISSACEGRVFRTDVGASRAFAKFAKTKEDIRKPAVLEILDDAHVKILTEHENPFADLETFMEKKT